jgi:hypothetical protein
VSADRACRRGAAPPAPTPLAPANGAQVTVPFTISWSAVSDPSGIIAYNWQVSFASTFASVIEQNSTSGQTQDTVSGLANGTYFWRVQAVNGAFIQGAWSAPQSFTVTGANAGAPGSPTLNAPNGGTQFHPMETISFTWSAVSGAASYIFDASNDPNFPVATKVHFDNIPNAFYSLTLGDSMPQGTWYVRVQAVNANGVPGVPSNTVTFTLSFNAPLPPPPSLLSPANGATVQLPITFTWTDVPNPQDSGYTLEIAPDPGFKTLDYLNNQITGAHWSVTSLTAGTKYWRVNSMQGDSAPGVPAVTAWSSTGSFVVPSTPTMGSLAVSTVSPFSGDTETVTVQLTAPAPAGGAVVKLTSTNPTAAPVPPSFTMPAGFAFGQFTFQAGQVTAATPVTLTGTLNATSASVGLTVQPPSLKSLTVSTPITGGVPTSAVVALNGVAPASGAAVSLTSSSASASPPATATVAPGNASVSVNIPTSAVTTTTTLTLTASWNGQSVQTPLTLTPQQPPASITLSPTTVSGSQGSFATVTLASAPTSDVQLPITTSNSAVTTVNNFVTIPAGTTNGGFNIFVTPVSTPTTVTISVSGAGVTKSATLTVNPAGAPPPPSGPSLSAVSLNPATVAAGSSSQGTVTFSSAVSAATTVSLSSGNTAASTPASVTVPAGSASATFTVTTTFVSGTTTVLINASAGGVNQSASLTITQQPAGATISAVTVSPTSVTGGNTAQGTVTLSAAAPSGGAAVSLTSNSTAATVPPGVTVAAGATSATFSVTTKAVTASTPVTISGTYGGATASASLTVTSATTDTVKVTLAEYDSAKKVLNVQATSTSSSATLQALVTSSGALIGTLTNNGGGKYQGQIAWPTNPQNVTVKSSLGGSGSLLVTVK